VAKLVKELDVDNLLDSISPVDADCFDPHSDAYAGGFGLPLSVQDEINAFADEMDMLRAEAEMAEQEPPAPEPESAKKAYMRSIGIAPKNKYAASVVCPDGRRVKAGTFKREGDAWKATDVLLAALKAKAGKGA
jgi:hypothetical protein